MFLCCILCLRADGLWNMNFYASQGFLEAAASVYFKGRAVAIENVCIGDEVLRLLVVDGNLIVTRLLFLDIHQTLSPDEIHGPVRKGRYAQSVSRGIIPVDAWDAERYRGLDLAPLIDWSGFVSFEDFYNRLLARHHGLMRDRERRGRSLASKYGDLTFTMDDQCDDVFALARQWKGQQLREMGFPDFFDAPQTLEFLEALRERGLLVSSTLRASGRLVSLWIGYVHEGSWSGWIFAYDPALKKFSPGHQLLIRMFEESYRRGHREFDFSGCAQDYKMLYATHGRLIGEIGTPPPMRALILFVRKVLLKYAPGLFAMALRAKWGVEMRGRRKLSTSVTVQER
jgi:hypothetical protein